MAKKVTAKKAAPAAETTQVQEVIYHNEVDPAIEKRLVALYTLQLVDSEIDKIRTIRGELPEAIQDLEDEITGLDTRMENFKYEVEENKKIIDDENKKIEDINARIAKLQEQQNNVRNNREFESINKELEYKDLEIKLAKRHISEANDRIKDTEQHCEAAQTMKEERLDEVRQKKEELGNIIDETEIEEKRLLEKSKEQEEFIDERYLTAYKRIRNAAHNGLAVVQIDRDACGGCFSQIPPQRQMEICMHKKVIVCEHCGRIIVDDDIAKKAKDLLKK